MNSTLGCLEIYSESRYLAIRVERYLSKSFHSVTSKVYQFKQPKFFFKKDRKKFAKENPEIRAILKFFVL